MNQTKIAVSVDHGNRHIKTPTHVFPASYTESGHLPSFGGDVLNYMGKEYTLVDQRMPQKTDKTKDNSYFILTLLAIGKELAGVIHDAVPSEHIEIDLLIGLPPLHCKEMSPRFTDYFKNHATPLSFVLSKRTYVISIADVYVYPQAYAAVMTVKERLLATPMVGLVDIGGYTVDLLQLVGLRPDMSVCTSLYGGVNSLFQKINEQVRATGAKNIPDNIIEGILLNDAKVMSGCSQERIDLVRSNAEQFTTELLLSVAQSGLDLTENQTVFVGGGSILLRDYIKKSGMVANPFFVENVCANAEGYQLLYNNRNTTRAVP